MGDLAVIKNELTHVRRSLSGLHRKADKTNGCVRGQDRRLTRLETLDVVTTADCLDRRLSGTRRVLWWVLSVVAAVAGGWALRAFTGGGG